MSISYTRIGDYLLPDLKIDDNKLSEKFKEKDSWQWTKLMNNYKNIAEEIVLSDYIFE